MTDPRQIDYPSVSRSYPTAERVSEHLAIEKSEWVPGTHPEPHLRVTGQHGYYERYLYCLRCGAEALSEDALPEPCEAAREPTGGHK